MKLNFGAKTIVGACHLHHGSLATVSSFGKDTVVSLENTLPSLPP